MLVSGAVGDGSTTSRFSWESARSRFTLPFRVQRSHVWIVGAIVAVVCALPVMAVLVFANAGHRSTPHPPGMVMRVEERQVESPLDTISVFAVDRGGPAIAVFTSDGTVHTAGPGGAQTLSLAHKATCRIYRYPDGVLLEQVTDAAARKLLETQLPSRRDQLVGDFDGDGTIDGLTFDRDGLVRIRSGSEGRVLFEDRDDLEYENEERAFFLGDLDGDGSSEVALTHPRMDRSRYDLELWDLLFGAKSWVSVVSWSRMDR